MSVVDKVVNNKYYGKFDTEKVDCLRLHYLYTIAFFLSFFLLKVMKVFASMKVLQEI